MAMAEPRRVMDLDPPHLQVTRSPPADRSHVNNANRFLVKSRIKNADKSLASNVSKFQERFLGKCATRSLNRCQDKTVSRSHARSAGKYRNLCQGKSQSNDVPMFLGRNVKKCQLSILWRFLESIPGKFATTRATALARACMVTDTVTEEVLAMATAMVVMVLVAMVATVVTAEAMVTEESSTVKCPHPTGTTSQNHSSTL